MISPFPARVVPRNPLKRARNDTAVRWTISDDYTEDRKVFKKRLLAFEGKSPSGPTPGPKVAPVPLSSSEPQSTEYISPGSGSGETQKDPKRRGRFVWLPPTPASIRQRFSRPARQQKSINTISLETPIFKNSYFNTAHYHNPDFSPEEWKPDFGDKGKD